MKYASFWKRAVAMVIDMAVMTVIYCLLMIVPFFPMVLIFLISMYYHVAFETSPLRATPGKALMGIAVVMPDGRQLTIKDSVVRYVMSYFSSALMGLGYFLALFTEKNQTMHDFVANTVVIEEKFAENNFWPIFVAQSKIIFNKDSISTPDNSFERKVDSQSLEDLYNLYQKGILTEEEYKLKKEEYLKKL